MFNFKGVAGGIAVIALVAGCAAPPPAPPMAAAAATPASSATASASGGADGVYAPPGGAVSGNSRCTRQFGNPIRVTGGVASLSTAVTGTLEGPVGPNGRLSILSGRAALNGQFADGTFNGTYSYGGCAYTLSYAKR